MTPAQFSLVCPTFLIAVVVVDRLCLHVFFVESGKVIVVVVLRDKTLIIDPPAIGPLVAQAIIILGRMRMN